MSQKQGQHYCEASVPAFKTALWRHNSHNIHPFKSVQFSDF